MHDAGPVRFLERIADLHAALQRLFQGQRPFLQPRFQSLALHILHHQVGGPILAAHVVQHANVRMIQGRNDAGFPLEALPGLGIVRKMRGQDLDGDGALQTRVAGAIHFSHAACSQRRLNFIGAKFCARGEGHLCEPL